MPFVLAATAFAQHPITFDDMAAMRRIGAPQVSPDGRWVAYDASTVDLPANYRHSAIYLVPANGGESRRITDGVKQDEGPAWSPDGKTIAYVSDRDGGAKQVWLYDVATNASRKLTNLSGWRGQREVDAGRIRPSARLRHLPRLRRRAAVHQGQDHGRGSKPSQARVITSLLFRHWTAWQEPTRSHIIFYPLTGAPRDLTPGAFDAPPFSLGGGDEFDISPDGKELVYARNTDQHPELSTNSDLFIVPIAGRRCASHHDAHRRRHIAEVFARRKVDRVSLAGARGIRIRSVGAVAVQPRYRDADARRPGLHELDRVVRVGAGQPHDLLHRDGERPHPDLRDDDRRALSKNLRQRIIRRDLGEPRRPHDLLSTRSTLQRPADLFSLTRDGQSTQITHDNDALLARLQTGAVTSTTWTGADNATIQGCIVTPPGFDATKKYPAIVLIHGGPQGAWGDGWSYRWNPQMFAARGYVVFMPNPRGSTGFGQKFVEEISGDWGGRAYVDIMNGVDKFAALPYVDSTRIGAAGASFGGYMIDWILGHTDRFKALVSHDGVYNLTSEYGVTEELWFPEWEFKGNPWDNPEQYEKWSPHMYAKNFKTPTLVVQGELDFRVPVDQGLQLFTTLQRKNIPSKLIYFPDEGHWVLKPQNSRLWYGQVLDWFDQWLKPRPSS